MCMHMHRNMGRSWHLVTRYQMEDGSRSFSMFLVFSVGVPCSGPCTVSYTVLEADACSTWKPDTTTYFLQPAEDSEGISLMSINTWQEDAERTESGSVSGAHCHDKRFPLNIRSTSVLCRWKRTDTATQRGRGISSLNISKSHLGVGLDILLRESLLEQGLGQVHPEFPASLSSSGILSFFENYWNTWERRAELMKLLSWKIIWICYI